MQLHVISEQVNLDSTADTPRTSLDDAMFSEYATEYRETRNNAWMWRPTLGSSKSKRLGSILRRSGSDLMNWQTNTRP
jgi:hypothetical protein